jgi:quinol monooxygenase YgiN
VQTDDGRRSELVELGQTLARASREEAGCLGYRMFADTEDPNRFVFIEEWEDDAALQAHFRTPHIQHFMSRVPKLVTAPPDVGFHTVSATRDLSNVTERPA